MAFDAFRKIDGIDGESTDKTHPGEIQVDSFSWGVTNTGGSGGSGGSGGKAVPQDFHFSAAVSKASPNLMLACATGQHFDQATLTCRKAGGNAIEFLKIKVYECLVSSYQLGGSRGDGPPEDNFSLAFVKIDFLYTVARTGEVVEPFVDFSNLPGT
jgi:type VI secretion system secreted protein Hcp